MKAVPVTAVVRGGYLNGVRSSCHSGHPWFSSNQRSEAECFEVLLELLLEFHGDVSLLADNGLLARKHQPHSRIAQKVPRGVPKISAYNQQSDP